MERSCLLPCLLNVPATCKFISGTDLLRQLCVLPHWDTSCTRGVGWLVGCLTSQQHASVSQGQICSDNCSSYHTEMQVAREELVGWLVGCLTSQQHASVSQGRICSGNCTSYHTEIQVAHQTFYLTQSQYTDTGSTSPSTDHITPGAWQGSLLSANF